MVYTPQYPATIPTYNSVGIPRVDGTSVINAIDVNSLYAETQQVATYLGQNPHIRSSGWGTGSFTSTTTFGNAQSRIANVENGTYLTYNDYLSNSAGTRVTTDSISYGTNTIQPAVGATSTVNLILKPVASQSVDLFQAIVGSTVVTKITKDGALWTAVIDGGSA
ncbi:hypothetical protein UFOVP221_112 [uncultured Caudovirales phage]|uniref:Uncharacterized protein n=1 Tax=uncultured Caudovirales phage TaxID=2100421 RepID=A0A6J7WPH0_9CAUD|nr:hypothetical protein UFOVP221_112 [uncultured Caudovirales phage]